MYSLASCLFFQVECNQQLGWYQHAKESQASVEKTSFSQMNIIMNYGCFIVGSKESHIFKSLHEVIQVVLKENVTEKKTEHSLAKVSYDLEELRDLESKLVLITGNKEEHRAQVDTFVDVRNVLSIIVLPCVNEVFTLMMIMLFFFKCNSQK